MSETGWSDGTLEAGLGSPRAAELCDWPARVRRMLEVETALARALARTGVISAAIADAVAAACRPDQVDVEALAREAAGAATPVIPLIAALARDASAEVAEALHHGATSQDIVDTAMVLQVREVIDLLDAELGELGRALAVLADEHRSTPMIGRTLLQDATPITFGLKAARWLGAVARRIEHLRAVGPIVLAAQLGGASGTLAVYGEAGVGVLEAYADELDLAVPELAWHAERDRIHDLAGVLGAVAATVAKIATDLVLLAQSAITEAVPGARAGGSSAMPHKRNPVDAIAARAAARLASTAAAGLLQGEPHEHERAAGGWQAEWILIPRLLVHTLGAVERLRAAVEDLCVDPERMRANLEAATARAAAATEPADIDDIDDGDDQARAVASSAVLVDRALARFAQVIAGERHA